MKQLFIVKVELPTFNPNSPFRKAFEHHLEVDSNLCVPFLAITDTLRFLFGKDCVITFSSRLIEYKNK